MHVFGLRIVKMQQFSLLSIEIDDKTSVLLKFYCHLIVKNTHIRN